MKSRLADAMIARFSDARNRRTEWVAHPERVADVRAAAASRARATARGPGSGSGRLRGGLKRRRERNDCGGSLGDLASKWQALVNSTVYGDSVRVYNGRLPGDCLWPRT